MRQLHCPECKTIDATLSGRCGKCGREMVPLVGKPIEPIKRPPTDVLPTKELLAKFNERISAGMGIPAEYLGPDRKRA